MITEKEKLKRYVDENNLYSKQGYTALDHRCRQVFKRVGDLAGKTMLEIGGGEGFFSLWALAHGVNRVTILEPEMDGSRPGIGRRLKEHARELNLSDLKMEFQPVSFQDCRANAEAFDVILSHSSINHLNEGACAQLDRSYSARMTYLRIFEKAHDFLRSEGHFVISDAGRLNFWGLLGLKSAFAPTIDWKKHQEPGLWQGLLEKAGFEFVALDWHRFYPLRWLGWLGANGLVARAITSQFILTVRKP